MLFLLAIGTYYVLQSTACILAIHYYFNNEKFSSCNIDNHRKPEEAAIVFDRPICIMIIYHVIELMRTTLLIAVLIRSSGEQMIMKIWYLLVFNTIFGFGAIVNSLVVLSSEAGQACAQHQIHRTEWLRIEVVLFSLCICIYTMPVLALCFCSKNSHNKILEKDK